MNWSSFQLNGQSCIYNADNGAQIATLNCLPVIFLNLLNFLLGFAGVVAVIMIIIAGIKYITSGGDAKQAEGAQKTLTYAVIGLIFIFLSGFLLNLVATIVGTECLTPLGFVAAGFGACK